jgi:hypothetical protein
MVGTFDMQIIVNSLFLGLLNCLQFSEKELKKERYI